MDENSITPNAWNYPGELMCKQIKLLRGCHVASSGPCDEESSPAPGEARTLETPRRRLIFGFRFRHMLGLSSQLILGSVWAPHDAAARQFSSYLFIRTHY